MKWLTKDKYCFWKYSQINFSNIFLRFIHWRKKSCFLIKDYTMRVHVRGCVRNRAGAQLVSNPVWDDARRAAAVVPLFDFVYFRRKDKHRRRQQEQVGDKMTGTGMFSYFSGGSTNFLFVVKKAILQHILHSVLWYPHFNEKCKKKSGLLCCLVWHIVSN